MIKVGYLVSYDYEFLFTSIRQVYPYVDEIYLAIDINKRTWSGNDFHIKDSFFRDLEDYDYRKIIKLYYDEFYIPNVKPIDLETRERNQLLKKMGKGWLIQLDVDEYIYNFEKISNYLRKYSFLTIFPKLTPIIFKGKLITLYRKLPEGFLYIENNEKFSFITNQDKFIYTRKNPKIRNHFTNIIVIHQSWGREDDEIKLKINNWGHINDFDTVKYYQFWKNLSITNYPNYKNIHPIVPEVWDELKFLPCNSIEDFISKYSKSNPQELININGLLMVKALFNKLFRTNG